MKTFLVAVNIVFISSCVLASPTPQGFAPVLPVFRQRDRHADSPRIVNGTEAAIGQFPYQAAITIDTLEFCGGSVITTTHILTAAHCIDRFKSWRVTLGAHNLKDGNEQGRQIQLSTEGIPHELYVSATFLNDIGLIVLPKPILMTDHIMPIKIPPAQFQALLAGGAIVRASGWGKISDSTTYISTTLQFIDLPIIPVDECAQTFPDVTPATFCTDGKGAKGACFGDSGSPVTLGVDGVVFQVGIVSFVSREGCEKGFPSGHTAVPIQFKWIKAKAGISG